MFFLRRRDKAKDDNNSEVEIENIDWDVVVEDLGPRLFDYFCVRFAKDQADDLVQETLIRLVRKVERKQFDSTRGNLRMLGFGIAHFVALEFYRVDKFTSIEEYQIEQKSTFDLDSILSQKRNSEIIRTAIGRLSQQEQQVISFLVNDEMTISEIS